jgi:hypothetical protein
MDERDEHEEERKMQKQQEVATGVWPFLSFETSINDKNTPTPP